MYIIDLNLLLIIILCFKKIEISRFKIEISRFQFWNLEIANFDSRDLKLKSRDSKFKTELRSLWVSRIKVRKKLAISRIEIEISRIELWIWRFEIFKIPRNTFNYSYIFTAQWYFKSYRILSLMMISNHMKQIHFSSQWSCWFIWLLWWSGY